MRIQIQKVNKNNEKSRRNSLPEILILNQGNIFLLNKIKIK